MRLAALLDLPHPDAPWLSHRDRLAEVAAALAILAGTCGKIARDVALLMQAEIGEVADAPSNGRGASTTLPQARNAATAAAALSAAATAPQLAATILTAQMQEHERALGGGQIEWTTFPALARVTSGALQAVAEIAEGLQVDAERMKQNLEASMVCAEAVSFALAPKLGRAQAHAVVTELARKAQTDKRALRDVLAADERIKAQLDDAALDRLLRATNYQGAAQTFLDRLVASALGRLVRRPDEMRSRVPDLKAEASVAPAEPVVPAAAVPETTVPTPEPLAAPPAPAPEPPVPQPPAVPQPSALLPPAPQIAPVAEVSEPAPIATAEPDPAAKPAVAPATAEPDPDAKPAAEAATAPAEPPSALIEVFARVAAITDEITSDHPADHESKPA
jgi:3-carboxy-cis,cis-muconate cycloisomerase